MSELKDKAEEDLLKSLDFDAACSLRVETYLLGRVVRQSAPCPNPARWTLRCRACGSSGVACDEHTRTILRTMEATCGACKATAPGGVLWEFKPLGGGS